MEHLDAAVAALRRGEVVLVYDADGREEETDMVVAGHAVTPDVVRTLRTDAGGLLCTAVGPDVHRTLGLPWACDVLASAAADHQGIEALLPRGDIRYDDSKPAFGLTVNHRDTFTGITDGDRSTTIRALAETAAGLDPADERAARAAFARDFRSPGHVQLLNGADRGLAARQGHTELSLELVRTAGLPAVATVCEMLDPRNGRALSRADAEAYAASHGLVFLTGADVLRAFWARAPAPTAVAAL